MQEIVIVSATRTPVGKFQGGLSSLAATELGAIAVREAVNRARIDAASVDECIMGCVLPAGLGQNPSRQAALRGGLSDTVSALTVNMVCGSGLRAVALAAQSVATGNAEIVVAGGLESMSNAPYLLPTARKGFRMGNATAVDSMIYDGLWCACEDFHMGNTAELVAEKYAIPREEQDAYALESHRRATVAQREGRFDAEIVPVSIPSRGGSPTLVSRDESIREAAVDDPAAALAALASLKPAFKSGGTVTAGNAPGVNDAAAALVVMSAERARSLGLTPLATIRAQATSGIAPKWVMLAPIEGVRKVLARAGWMSDSVDLFELNEAFSVQALAVRNELGLDPERVNVNGGAVAIGHPIGASGARVLVTLLHEMQRRNVHRGVAALCLGGGNSVALAVERDTVRAESIMNANQFSESLSSDVPPSALTLPAQALWWDAKGDWVRAHELVNELETSEAMAVHAYLHRKEGEEWNANYWYRRAGEQFRRASLQEEWSALVEGLLKEPIRR